MKIIKQWGFVLGEFFPTSDFPIAICDRYLIGGRFKWQAIFKISDKESPWVEQWAFALIQSSSESSLMIKNRPMFKYVNEYSILINNR